MSTPSPTLTLILPAGPQTVESVSEATTKDAPVRVEITIALQTRIEDLRREVQRVYGTLEQAMFRISAQGVEVKLDDLKLGQSRLQNLAGEVEALQEVLVVVTCQK